MQHNDRIACPHRPARVAALVALALLAACGSGAPEVAAPPPGDPPSVDPPPSDSPPADPPPADPHLVAALPPPTSLAEDGPEYVTDRVVETWEDVRAASHAVFPARWIWREPPDEATTWCFEPLADAPGVEGDAPRERICTLPRDVLGDGGISSEYEEAWVVTVLDGDRQAPYAFVGLHCEDGDCGEVPRRELIDRVRCGQIHLVWTRIPGQHRRCTADDECAVIVGAGNCFEQAVHRDFEALYREFLERHGPGCSYAVMGMCPPEPVEPECFEGICVNHHWRLAM